MVEEDLANYAGITADITNWFLLNATLAFVKTSLWDGFYFHCTNWT